MTLSNDSNHGWGITFTFQHFSAHFTRQKPSKFNIIHDTPQFVTSLAQGCQKKLKKKSFSIDVHGHIKLIDQWLIFDRKNKLRDNLSKEEIWKGGVADKENNNLVNQYSPWNVWRHYNIICPMSITFFWDSVDHFCTFLFG